MDLVLADHNQTFYTRMAQPPMLGQNNNKETPYMFVPAGMVPGYDDVYVNEKEFDDLNEYDWNRMMAALEPYQNNGMSAWPFSTKKSRARKKERKQERQARKVQTIETRSAGRVQKQYAKTGQPSQATEILSGIAGAIFGGGGGNGAPVYADPVYADPGVLIPAVVNGAIPKGYEIDPLTGKLVESKKWYQKTEYQIAMGVGGLLILVAGVAAVRKGRGKK